MSDLSLVLYFLTDHPLYLHNVGLWKFSPSFMANCNFINNVFWLLSSLFDILVTVVEIGHMKAEVVGQAAKVRNVKAEFKDEAK